MPEIADGTALTQWHYLAFILAWVGGILTRFAQAVRTEKVSAKQYFVSYPMSTMAALCVSLAVCIVMALQGENSLVTYFSVAFVVETLINRSGTGGK